MIAPLPTSLPVRREHAGTPRHDYAIDIRGLVKRYPAQRGWRDLIRQPLHREWIPALLNLDLQIPNGQFFGLLGPNGAGKTTLFKILSTIIQADGGTIAVHGHDVTRQPHAVRRLVTPVIADERSLRWRLSARENLLLYAHLYSVQRSAIPNRVGQLLDVVGLGDVGDRMVGTFSTGMKQRLALARALLAEPAVLLLDEPTRSLDPISARSLRAFLREEIGTRRGTTILLATHLAEEAFDLCDRVGVLHQGRLLACGSVDELADDFSDTTYRIWTSAPQHPVLRAAGTRNAGNIPAAEPWHVVEMDIHTDEEAAETLRGFVAAGVPIMRFEKSHLTLADLIERVVAQRSSQ